MQAKTLTYILDISCVKNNACERCVGLETALATNTGEQVYHVNALQV